MEMPSPRRVRARSLQARTAAVAGRLKGNIFDLPARRACINGYTLRLAGVVSLLAFGLPLAGSAAPRQQLRGGHVPAAVARLAPAGSLWGSLPDQIYQQFADCLRSSEFVE